MSEIKDIIKNIYKNNKKNMKNMIPYVVITLFLIICSLYFVAFLDSLLRRSKLDSNNLFYIIQYIASSESTRKLFFYCIIAIILVVIVLILSNTKNYQSDQIIVTPDISIPVPAGQGQCGTAKWLPKNQFDNVFANNLIEKQHPLIEWLKIHALDDILGELKRIEAVEEEIEDLKQQLESKKMDSNTKHKVEQKLELKIDELTDQKLVVRTKDIVSFDEVPLNILNTMEGGIVLGKKDSKFGELIYYIKEDVHTLILGATRAGKGRCIVIQTICFLALALENILCFDPKRENYYYTKPLLKALGYDIILIDFKNPKRSTRFNFLQPIINCIDKDDIPGAIDATWDLTSN